MHAIGGLPPDFDAADIPPAPTRRFRLAPDQRVDAAQRRRLLRDLEAATHDGAFVLQYQPLLSLESGRLTGAEALPRWPHRRRGPIPPSVFTPLAEQSGLITAIGGWALRTACKAASGWPAGAGVWVTVSPRQLADQALLRQIAEALEESGLEPERLEIALAETTLMAVDVETLLTLSAIRDLGVGLALDDFGTGFASLSLLKRLPLTVMKLDRAMVRDLPRDREDAAIVRAVITAGHALGLSVVAEGIETGQQLAFLTAAGCDHGQGFLFGPPLPPERMAARLAEA